MRESCPSLVCPVITQSLVIMRLLFITVLFLLFCTIESKKVKKEKKAVEEVAHQEEVHDGPFAHSSFVRPRQLLRQSKYEKCKADCARIKEQEDMHTYLAQLREELAAAEALIAEEEVQSPQVDEEVVEEPQPPQL
ncbi:hypothetical protein PRIPAC_85162 [Pristionchus pacificus]|uniref:Uncharacterized protein n=1 Tax=Pristionchus pacificus TaxID=54126 RepID=A0A2A6BUD7_PRIPA|nr:hypothetical protein PRIPAC_85162 [Pristionchus pacificus]|eukprot:PDM69519.1 hypothetical protein PRIPAC_44615 [Pristionchus pacificus]